MPIVNRAYRVFCAALHIRHDWRFVLTRITSTVVGGDDNAIGLDDCDSSYSLLALGRWTSHSGKSNSFVAGGRGRGFAR